MGKMREEIKAASVHATTVCVEVEVLPHAFGSRHWMAVNGHLHDVSRRHLPVRIEYEGVWSPQPVWTLSYAGNKV